MRRGVQRITNSEKMRKTAQDEKSAIPTQGREKAYQNSVILEETIPASSSSKGSK